MFFVSLLRIVEKDIVANRSCIAFSKYFGFLANCLSYAVTRGIPFDRTAEICIRRTRSFVAEKNMTKFLTMQLLLPPIAPYLISDHCQIAVPRLS